MKRYGRCRVGIQGRFDVGLLLAVLGEQQIPCRNDRKKSKSKGNYNNNRLAFVPPTIPSITPTTKTRRWGSRLRGKDEAGQFISIFLLTVSLVGSCIGRRRTNALSIWFY
jgi:hypothetical protein